MIVPPAELLQTEVTIIVSVKELLQGICRENLIVKDRRIWTRKTI